MAITRATLNKWAKAKAALDEAKKAELALRLDICNEVISGIKGTYHKIVGDIDIVATAKVNVKVDTEVLDTIWNKLSQLEKDCIEFKPTLIAKQYKTITDPKSKLHQAIITTPGTPALELKPVKK